MAGGGRIWAVVVALLAWLAIPAPATAEASADGRTLSLCVAPLSAAATPGGAAARAGAFDCRRAQMAWGPGDYWISTRPLADTRALRLRIVPTWNTRIRLWAHYADGHLVPVPIDWAAMAPPMGSGIALPRRAAPLDRLLWRADGAANVRGIIHARLFTDTAGVRYATVVAMLNAGFLGLCLALIASNLALWAALRKPFQLAYCTMVAGLAFYAANAWGIFFPLLSATGPEPGMRLHYFAIAPAMAAALWFARTFFEPHVLAGWPDRVLRVLPVLLLATSALHALTAPWQMDWTDRLHGLTFVGVLAMTAPILWRAWSRRSRHRWLFPLAWAAPAMLAYMRVANTFHWTATVLTVRDLLLVLMTAWALVSSLAVAYRVHLLARERDEAREQEIAARLLADTDPLTGLLNRRAFLAQAIGRAGEQTLLVADLDHFKQVNETIGHDGGDEVLRVFARALIGVAPPGALVARIGGEEFAIVAAADAGMSARAILASLRVVRMPYDIAVTTSIGTCTGPLAREVDWKTLYRQADRALYAAKDAGRDRAHDAATLPLAA